MIRCSMLPLVLALLPACGDLPRDPDGTLDRVRASKVIRLGVPTDTTYTVGAGGMMGRIQRVTGARFVTVHGDNEQLLGALEAGRLDLVLALFDPKTPWKTRVALAPPLFKGYDLQPDKERMELRAAARNGENAWITVVQRAAKAEDGE